MKPAKFKDVLHSLKELTDSDRDKSRLALACVGGEQKVLKLIESRFTSQDCCPHCGSVEYHRHGHAHHLQRYRCKDRQKTFNALTGTH